MSSCEICQACFAIAEVDTLTRLFVIPARDERVAEYLTALTKLPGAGPQGELGRWRQYFRGIDVEAMR